MKENIDMQATCIDQIELNLSALPQIGEVMDEKYQIVREIERGGMGVVYEAIDLMLNRKIAIKILQFTSNSTIAIKRFERELKVCSQLSHPNIVKMYNCGIYKKSPYMVMEYIQGISISEYIKKHDPAYGTSDKRDYNLCVKLILQVADALEYIHKQNIYHRDIKPSNILVCDDEKVVLIDFGIVKFKQDQSYTLTRANDIIGTCNYMSPEQIGGEKINHQSDIYSLGMVLYELLTEKIAFSGSMISILNQVITVTPDSPKTINNNIPNALDKIVMHAIEKDRRNRYKNIKQFSNALEEYLEKQNTLETRRLIRKQNTADTKKYTNNSRIHFIRKWEKLFIAISIIMITISTIFYCIQLIDFQYIVDHKVLQNLEQAVKLFKKLDNSTKIQKSLIECQYQLGLMYYNKEDKEKAIFWLGKVANQGHAQAKFYLAMMCEEGKVIKKDFKKAIYWFQKKYEQGDKKASLGRIYYKLALEYSEKQNSIKSLTEAYKLFEQAREQGYKEPDSKLAEIPGIVENNLGYMYYNGKGVKKDFNKAKIWFEKSAKKNIKEAQHHLGLMYEKGQGVKKNLEEAYKWYEKASKQGHQDAKKKLPQIQYQLGNIYANGQGGITDLKKAFEYFKNSANLGDAGAKYELGHMYLTGNGVEKNLSKAFQLFENSSNLGHAGAKYELAYMYLTGNGVEKNLSQAFQLFENSANLGHAGAKYELGHMYLTGNGIEKNLAKAFQLFESSANLGHAGAKYELAHMYLTGNGVEKNFSQAYNLLLESSKLGHFGAKKILIKIKAILKKQKQSDNQKQ